jgi:hypothetical protein
MDISAKNGVDDPFAQFRPRYPNDIFVVVDAEQNTAAFEVRQSDDFFIELFRAYVVPFELDAGVFAVCD